MYVRENPHGDGVKTGIRTLPVHSGGLVKQKAIPAETSDSWPVHVNYLFVTSRPLPFHLSGESRLANASNYLPMDSLQRGWFL